MVIEVEVFHDFSVGGYKLALQGGLSGIPDNVFDHRESSVEHDRMCTLMCELTSPPPTLRL